MLSPIPSRRDQDEASGLLPSNIDAEEAVLGAILLDPGAIARVEPILQSPQAFYIHAHRQIYAAALAIDARQQPVDLMHMATYLRDASQLEAVGGQLRLVQLLDKCISSALVDEYARLIADKHVRRQIKGLSSQIDHLAAQTAKPLSEVLGAVEEATFSITQQMRTSEVLPVASVVADVFVDIEARSEGAVLPGVTSGFYDLDAMTQGFQRTDLVIVAARPAMGKTALLICAAINAAKAGEPVLICSLEMSREQLVYRMISQVAKIESGRLRTGRIAPSEWEPLGHAIAFVSSLPIFIDDAGLASVSEIGSKAREIKAREGGLGLVVVDYLQLMEGAGDNRVQDLDKITRGFKRLAGKHELDVPVVLLSQLSRGVESRTNKRPMMSDLRESGGLEQNADVVMMLYREEYYDPSTPDRGIAEIIITKHRNGPTGTVKLIFQPEYTLFLNRARPMS